MSILMVGSIVVTVLIAMATKFITKRKRPDALLPGFRYAEFLVTDRYSFPSGHAGRCWAMATVAAWFYPVWGGLAIPLALLIIFARVALGVHFISDVIVGAGIGIGAAYGLCFAFA